MFGSVNVATDQNQLLKDLMDRIQTDMDESIVSWTFAGLNGSGKHNNISDTGVNFNLPGAGKFDVFSFFCTYRRYDHSDYIATHRLVIIV